MYVFNIPILRFLLKQSHSRQHLTSLSLHTISLTKSSQLKSPMSFTSLNIKKWKKESNMNREKDWLYTQSGGKVVWCHFYFHEANFPLFLYQPKCMYLCRNRMDAVLALHQLLFTTSASQYRSETGTATEKKNSYKCDWPFRETALAPLSVSRVASIITRPQTGIISLAHFWILPMRLGFCVPSLTPPTSSVLNKSKKKN